MCESLDPRIHFIDRFVLGRKVATIVFI